jgi:flagellar hook-basal body complex protein FliE
MIDSVALSTVAKSAFEDSMGGSSAVSGSTANAVGSETPFASVLHGAMEQMGKLEQDASDKVSGMLSGNGVDVHTAMIATQKSDLAYQLTLAVRNKAVDAYTQLNSMQF